MNATQVTTPQKTTLICGILSSLWYVIINIFVPTQYEGYHLTSFTISELSAIDAPTRQLWVIAVIPYPLLFGIFGWGILLSAGTNKSLSVIGKLILAYSVFNSYWPPMHMRGNEPTLTDTLHIVWAFVTVLMMMVMMVLGAVAFGKRFRFYTISSIVLLIVFGILTSLEAPNIPTNGPTPWIGVWERINIGVFMLWVIVLSIILLTSPKKSLANKGI